MSYFLLFVFIVGCIIWLGWSVLRRIFSIFIPTDNNRQKNQRQQSNQQQAATTNKDKQFRKSEGKYVDYEEMSD